MKMPEAHPGYLGCFVDDNYEGALLKGTRITKHVSEPGDATPTGTLGTILGSSGHPSLPFIFYWVVWDNRPGYAVGVLDWKIKAIQ